MTPRWSRGTRAFVTRDGQVLDVTLSCVTLSASMVVSAKRDTACVPLALVGHDVRRRHARTIVLIMVRATIKALATVIKVIVEKAVTFAMLITARVIRTSRPASVIQ